MADEMAAGPASQVKSALDVITIGRSSVDLYGQQIGSKLEDIASFAKSVGGCPLQHRHRHGAARPPDRASSPASATSRWAASSASRWREGVATAGIATDPERLTALVLLAVEDEGVSPMIFYRTDCADMALSEADVDEAFVAGAHAIVVTGTHFSREASAAAQKKAIAIARANGGRVVSDIDYRPNLWGLAGHAEGFERYVKSERVSAALKAILPDCDLVVGTEEEIRIASGADDVLGALKAIRAVSAATIVLKRGAMGCIVYDGPIADDLEAGIVGDGFPIEVFNVLGAGDAFMSGFLRGWLKGEPLQTCATWANACGAFAVSRLLCSPEYPTWAELSHFLAHGSKERALRKDADLAHIHWATTRRETGELLAFAIDHRSQLEAVADRLGVPRARIEDLKVLAVEAAARVARGQAGFRHASRRVPMAARLSRRRPSTISGSAGRSRSRVRGRSISIISPISAAISSNGRSATPSSASASTTRTTDPALKARQERELLRLADAARTVGRELLVEIIAGKHGPLDDDTVATVMDAALRSRHPPRLVEGWSRSGAPPPGRRSPASSRRAIPSAASIVMLGLEAPEADGKRRSAPPAATPLVRGFAVRAYHLRRGGGALAGGSDDRRGGDRRHGLKVRAAGGVVAEGTLAGGGLRRFLEPSPRGEGQNRKAVLGRGRSARSRK